MTMINRSINKSLKSNSLLLIILPLSLINFLIRLTIFTIHIISILILIIIKQPIDKNPFSILKFFLKYLFFTVLINITFMMLLNFSKIIPLFILFNFNTFLKLITQLFDLDTAQVKRLIFLKILKHLF